MSDKTSSTSDSDGPSYFTLAGRQFRSSELDRDSPPISPSTLRSAPSASARPVRRRIRPRAKSRAKSDEASAYSRPRVQTIDEDEPSNDSTPQGVGSPFRPGLVKGIPHSPDTQSSHRSVSGSHGSSSRTSLKSIAKKLCFISVPELTELHKASVPIEDSEKGGTHARGDSGVRKKKKTSSHDHCRLTRSAENIRKGRSRSNSEKPPPLSPVIPLRPPLNRNSSGPGPAYHHAITLETPFTLLQTPPAGEIPTAEPPPSRRSSLLQDILIAPLVFVRKLSKTKSTTSTIQKARTSTSTSESHRVVLTGHATQLRKTHTNEALRQVSHLLRGVADDRSDSRSPSLFPKPLQVRSMSDKSSTSVVSKENSKLKRGVAAEGVPVPGSLVIQKSMEPALPASDSSSIRGMKLGPPPNATPDELATYKIKRSPSAETEKFLKVDISIRGGTSYLPSEARRIHTPPLPGESITGRRRGFFFDYNAPRHSLTENSKGFPSYGRMPPASENGVAKCESHRGMASSASTIDKKIYPCIRAGRRPRGDWYETQLAGLDDENEDDEVKEKEDADAEEISVSLDFHPMRERTARALCNIRHQSSSGSDSQVGGERRKSKVVQGEFWMGDVGDEDVGEEGVDYLVPEHLPSSPLCPANVRYWRAVERKMRNLGRTGSFCWMHGGMGVGGCRSDEGRNGEEGIWE